MTEPPSELPNFALGLATLEPRTPAAKAHDTLKLSLQDTVRIEHRPTPSAFPADAALAAHDKEWSNELVQLIAELEQRRVRLVEHDAAGRADKLLADAIAAVDRLQEFTKPRNGAPRQPSPCNGARRRPGKKWRGCSRRRRESPAASWTNTGN
jgi:hypothetical protein